MKNDKSYIHTVYIISQYKFYLRCLKESELIYELKDYNSNENYALRYVGNVYRSFMSLGEIEKRIFSKIYIDRKITRKKLNKEEKLYLDVATLKFLDNFYEYQK